MKKLLFMAIAAFLMVGVAGNSQSKKQLKGIQKMAVAAAKKDKKDGFTNLEMGSTEFLFEKYLTKTNIAADGEKPMKGLVGVAYNVSSLNLAKQNAIQNAIVEYANQRSGMIKGRAVSEMVNKSEKQVDDFIAAYERILVHKITGELQVEVTVYREKRKLFEVKVYCVVEWEAARQANAEALKQALEEQELYHEFGTRASEWIDEGLVD